MILLYITLVGTHTYKQLRTMLGWLKEMPHDNATSELHNSAGLHFCAPTCDTKQQLSQATASTEQTEKNFE